MDSENLELLNDLFDALDPDEQRRFVLRALGEIGIEVVDLAEIRNWKAIHRAVRELGLLRDGDEQLIEDRLRHNRIGSEG
jgi:hypothetical protein